MDFQRRTAVDAITRMLIEHDCRKLSDLYCKHLDHRNPDGFASLFTEDAVYKPAIQPVPIETRARILEWFHTYPADRTVRHLSTNQVVDVIDERTAKGTSYALTFREAKPEEGKISSQTNPRAVVEYVDTYRRTDDGWKFATRYYNIDFLQADETNRPPRTHSLSDF
jgi:hypothetical protein